MYKSIIMSLSLKSFHHQYIDFRRTKLLLKSLEHRLSNFLEWGTLPGQYGIVPVTLALALLIKFVLGFMD